MSDDDVLRFLAEHNNNLATVVKALLPSRSPHRELLEYLLNAALLRIRQQARKKQRTRIKVEELYDIRVQSILPAKPRYEISEGAKQKIRQRTLTMLTTWMIGDMPLADMEKAGLLAAAVHEKNSGNGHFVNAQFYEALAEPMNDIETVKDHWQDEGARLLHESILEAIMKASRSEPRQSTSTNTDDRVGV